jgi:hypothetical protein
VGRFLCPFGEGEIGDFKCRSNKRGEDMLLMAFLGVFLIWLSFVVAQLDIREFVASRKSLEEFTAMNGVVPGLVYFIVWKKCLDLSGRASRKEYWWFIFWQIILFSEFALIGFYFNSPIPGLIYLLVSLLPLISICIRRMHDTNHNGWWLFVPIMNLIFMLTKSAVTRRNQ